MENGCKLYTPVVFNLDDLKEIYERNSHGKKGMWGFHSRCHEGHKQCAELTNKKCDWVIGILWNNFAAGVEWMTGTCDDVDHPLYSSDINELKQKSDVVMIFTGDYHPYKEHWQYIKPIFDSEFSERFLQVKGITDQQTLYGSLLYSVAVRIVIHEIYGLRVDYQAASGRDRWKHVKYNDWLYRRYGLYMDLQDAVRDYHGNVISGTRNNFPEEYNNRINKTLLLPEFKTIEEVNEHIKDIPDLKAVHFAREYGWIHVKFQFDSKHWWTEGLKLCK